MADFTDETKREIGKYFSEGVYKVSITGVKADKTQDGKEFFEVSVLGENDEEAAVRIYWTEKAAPFSFNAIRDIFVHNTVEKNKQLIRDKVDATKNTDELLKLCSDNLVGKECWYKLEKTGSTYRNANGEERNSYNRNLYGYEPKPIESKDDVLKDIEEGASFDLSEVPFE